MTGDNWAASGMVRTTWTSAVGRQQASRLRERSDQDGPTVGKPVEGGMPGRAGPDGSAGFTSVDKIRPDVTGKGAADSMIRRPVQRTMLDERRP
jgi:hypothetical protein